MGALFLLSHLELFSLFYSTGSLCSPSHHQGFIHILFKFLNVFRIAMLESLPCALALLHFSGLTVTGLLAPDGGI